VSYFFTCSLPSMTDFQAEQFENTTWSSTKSTTANFVIYIKSEDGYDFFIEELHKILMRICQFSAEPLPAKNDPEEPESRKRLHQSRGRPG
jgi:hypothetical protein